MRESRAFFDKAFQIQLDGSHAIHRTFVFDGVGFGSADGLAEFNRFLPVDAAFADNLVVRFLDVNRLGASRILGDELVGVSALVDAVSEVDLKLNEIAGVVRENFPAGQTVFFVDNVEVVLMSVISNVHSGFFRFFRRLGEVLARSLPAVYAVVAHAGANDELGAQFSMEFNRLFQFFQIFNLTAAGVRTGAEQTSVVLEFAKFFGGAAKTCVFDAFVSHSRQFSKTLGGIVGNAADGVQLQANRNILFLFSERKRRSKQRTQRERTGSKQ